MSACVANIHTAEKRRSLGSLFDMVCFYKVLQKRCAPLSSKLERAWNSYFMRLVSHSMHGANCYAATLYSYRQI